MPQRLAYVGILACALCAALSADSINPFDPRIAIDTDGPDPIHVTTNPFTFTPNQNDGGFLVFENDTGVNWFELTVDAPLRHGTTTSDIVCSSNIFTCTSIDEGPSMYVDPNTQENFELFAIDFKGDAGHFIAYHGFQPLPGAPPVDDTFSVNLNDSPEDTSPDGEGTWILPPGVPMAATYAGPNGATPEPASFVLLLSGGVLLGLRSLRKRA